MAEEIGIQTAYEKDNNNKNIRNMEKRRLLNFLSISESDFCFIILFIYSNGEWRVETVVCKKSNWLNKDEQKEREKERERMKKNSFNSAIAYFISQERSFRAKWITVSNRKMAMKEEEKKKSYMYSRHQKGRKTNCWQSEWERRWGLEVEQMIEWEKNEEKHWR